MQHWLHSLHAVLNAAHWLADHQKLGESTAALIETQAANARLTAALAQQATDTNKQLTEALEALSQAHEAQEALEAENTQLAQSVIKLTLRVETLEQLVGGSSKYSDVKPKGEDGDDKPMGDDDEPSALMKKRFLSRRWVNRDVVRIDMKSYDDDGESKGHCNSCKGDGKPYIGDGDQLKDGDKPKGDDDEPSALMKRFLSMRWVNRDIGGHDLRTFFGYRVCLKCYAHAKELKGKRRALGMLCAPAKLPSAQAERRRKAEKIMRGVDPRTTGVTLK